MATSSRMVAATRAGSSARIAAMSSLCRIVASRRFTGNGTWTSPVGTSGHRLGRSFAIAPIWTSPRIPSVPIGNMVTDSTWNTLPKGFSIRLPTPWVTMYQLDRRSVIEIQSHSSTAVRMLTYCSRISSIVVAQTYCSVVAPAAAPSVSDAAIAPIGSVQVHGPAVSSVARTVSMSWLYSERRWRQPR